LAVFWEKQRSRLARKAQVKPRFQMLRFSVFVMGKPPELQPQV
jgi:hypothetical protein